MVLLFIVVVVNISVVYRFEMDLTKPYSFISGNIHRYLYVYLLVWFCPTRRPALFGHKKPQARQSVSTSI